EAAQGELTAAGVKKRSTVRDRARERGLEPVLGEAVLSKHMRLVANWRDASRIRAYAAAEGIDLLHAHLPNDHSIARRAAGAPEAPRIVRTSYDGEAMKATLRQRRALAATDALICVSPAVARDAGERFGYPADRTFTIESPVDTARFDPARRADLREAGERLLGVAPGDFVVGIVARMQTHRRFEVLLEALRLAAAGLPRLRAVVIGRGTNQEAVAKEPARRLGLGEVIRFPGYLEGEDYVAALAALDVKVFLVPGSDGSCRAVREALAMGRPVIAARRGMLPEIVKDGETGLVVEDEPAPLAEAIGALARDDARRRAMSARAREDARRRFSIEAAAREVKRAYEATLARPRRIAVKDKEVLT
ncbi:MAG TPA: glycosyltransferase family 4 protein, partial [Planctomycetota bacterium]|nr:glycosyltransferase family 4 protein [Planctomycetota bacterium]